MMPVDWSAMVLGLVTGAALSAVFFAGLGLGIRVALRSVKPVSLLLISAAVRMSALLGVGWVVADFGGFWALLGYASAFLVIRFIATTIAREVAPSGGAP